MSEKISDRPTNVLAPTERGIGTRSQKPCQPDGRGNVGQRSRERRCKCTEVQSRVRRDSQHSNTSTRAGDPRRFPTAPRVMAFVGLVPTEYSSGLTRAQGAITKTGNAHLRRVLIEAAWHYRHHPSVGNRRRGRQRGAPPAAIRQAWVAQQRLCRRFRRLMARGKPRSQVVTAVARELTGFLWAALTP